MESSHRVFGNRSTPTVKLFQLILTKPKPKVGMFPSSRQMETELFPFFTDLRKTSIRNNVVILVGQIPAN